VPTLFASHDAAGYSRTLLKRQTRRHDVAEKKTKPMHGTFDGSKRRKLREPTGKQPLLRRKWSRSWRCKQLSRHT
jgi:hypothetical protein